MEARDRRGIDRVLPASPPSTPSPSATSKPRHAFEIRYTASERSRTPPAAAERVSGTVTLIGDDGRSPFEVAPLVSAARALRSALVAAAFCATAPREGGTYGTGTSKTLMSCGEASNSFRTQSAPVESVIGRTHLPLVVPSPTENITS